MLACVDVDYRATEAVAACIVVPAWGAETASSERVTRRPGAAAYEPGEFFKRELPSLVQVLDGVLADVVVIDAYVWLAGGRPGLGLRLHEALPGRPAVVGVAKTEFRGAPAVPVLRGKSRKPLFVTAVGIAAEEAAEGVRSMRGEFRIPTILRAVDRLARTG